MFSKTPLNNSPPPLSFKAIYSNIQFNVPLAKKELLKEVSYYTTHLRLRDLRENGCSMSKRQEDNVKTVECRESEPICCDESSNSGGPFCFFMPHFSKGSLASPLSIFEKNLLTELNVSRPSTPY